MSVRLNPLCRPSTVLFVIGIQFGEGFDEGTVIRMSQTITKEHDYDLIVIGSNPGGVACAREARLAGRKTAIITWKSCTPAEANGIDEDLNEMSLALDQSIPHVFNSKRPSSEVGFGSRKSLIATKKSVSTMHKASFVIGESGTKVRRSRLDLNNELFKRGKQCRKLMHNAIRLGELVEDAWRSGWRLTTTRPPLTMNWHKMSEEVMDYVMEENYKLAEELADESVEVIEGLPAKFEDVHTVKVIKADSSECEFTSEFICLALSAECILPENIPGAQKYGICCDDFIRLSEPPGKTLIVGSTLEGIECAGIIAGSRLPCTVVSRSKILRGYDSGISQMIMNDLRSKGVVFKEETTLTSIASTPDKKLLAKFRVFSEGDDSATETDETFDTVLFAVGRMINPKNFNISDIGIVVDPLSLKIEVDSCGQTAVENIYAVGDIAQGFPEDFEVSQLAGKLLGKRLFREGTEVMNDFMIPTVMYTPTEYAYVGMSENGALDRLGMDCVDVFHVDFKPLDFFIPSKTGKGLAKIITLKSNDSIIGLHIYGPEAGEIIQGFAAAIRNGLTLTNFRTIVGVTATKAQEILKLKDKINFTQNPEE